MSKSPLPFKKCHRCGEQIGWDETPNPICIDCAVERIAELEAECRDLLADRDGWRDQSADSGRAATRLLGENAKLRKCVEAADDLRTRAATYRGLTQSMDRYDAARAEVDKP